MNWRLCSQSLRGGGDRRGWWRKGGREGGKEGGADGGSDLLQTLLEFWKRLVVKRITVTWIRKMRMDGINWQILHWDWLTSSNTKTTEKEEEFRFIQIGIISSRSSMGQTHRPPLTIYSFTWCIFERQRDKERKKTNWGRLYSVNQTEMRLLQPDTSAEEASSILACWQASDNLMMHGVCPVVEAVQTMLMSRKKREREREKGPATLRINRIIIIMNTWLKPSYITSHSTKIIDGLVPSISVYIAHSWSDENVCKWM